MPKRITASLRLFQNRYFIFIITIALTVIASDLFMRHALNKQTKDAELINVAGRQRMLSQRIAKRVLYSYYDIKESGTTEKFHLDTLKELCDEFETAHYRLLQECKTNNSSTVTSLLKSNTPYLNNIIKVCRQAVITPDDSSFTYAKKIIQQNELFFLLNAEQIVNMIQQESEDKLSIVKNTELALTIVTIFCLTLEFIFIIIPLIKRLRLSNNTLAETSAALEKVAAELKAILGAAHVSIISTDVNGIITSFNKGAESLLGYTAAEMIGKQTPEIIHAKKEIEQREEELSVLFNREVKGFDVFTQYAKQGKYESREWIYIHKDGHTFPVQLVATAITNVREEITGFLGVATDITELKKTHEMLEQSEELFRQTFNYSAIGIALVALDGKWIKVNRSLCNMLGYNESEFLQIKFQDITHPDDLSEDLQLIEELLKERIQSYQLEKRYFHKEGHIVWVLLSVSLVRDHVSTPVHFISQVMDITASKQAERIIREERKLLVTLINNIPVNVFVKDLQSRKVLVNQSEIGYMGVTNETEILGKDDLELFSPESAAISMAEDQEVFNSGAAFINRETVNFQHKGKEHYFLTSKIPLKNEQGEVTGLLGISFDITDRKINEKRLKELADITTEQNTRLLNFAHIVSHNLRSHASNFSMLLHFLETEEEATQQKEMFALLKRASANLTETVTHLNEVVAVNTNIAGETEPVNLNSAIIKVQDNINALMLKEHVLCINNIDENIYIQVVPAYLESILLNFFTNAIKYKSPERAPVITLSTEKNDKYTILSIQDNGAGIDIGKYGHKLFGMYKTFHGNKDARGVGLFITKNQVEAMGGKIEVESVPGEGTIFKIYFL